MSPYRRPAFWILFLWWQLVAFLLASCVATACHLAANVFLGPPDQTHARAITWLATIAHILFAAAGFLLAKRRPQLPPQPPGFPVIPTSHTR